MGTGNTGTLLLENEPHGPVFIHYQTGKLGPRTSIIHCPEGLEDTDILKSSRWPWEKQTLRGCTVLSMNQPSPHLYRLQSALLIVFSYNLGQTIFFPCLMQTTGCVRESSWLCTWTAEHNQDCRPTLLCQVKIPKHLASQAFLTHFPRQHESFQRLHTLPRTI